MKLIMRYLKPLKGSLAIVLMLKSLGTIAELALPYILSYILGSIVVRESISQILLWGGLMVVFSVVAWGLNVTANRRSELLTRTAIEKLRKDLFDKTIRLSASQTDKFTIASLEARITTDTYNIRHFLGTMQRMGIRQPIMLLGGVLITLFMDAHLALVMIAMVPIVFVVVCFISMKGVPLYTKVQHSVDGMTRVVREDVSGIRVIKALSKENYEQNRYDVTNKALVKDEKKASITMGLVNPIMTLSMNLGIVVVVVLAAYRIQGGTSAPETVIAFMQYFTLISNALMGVTRLFVMFTKAEASSKRINEVLTSEEDLRVADKSEYPDIETDKHIVFRNVSFSYEGKKNNLENINLEIERGGTLGVIGATGSGKSTLIKLLMRFYDVTDGRRSRPENLPERKALHSLWQCDAERFSVC
ncbi:MAG: ABC transporter ATP-binding protein [Oscillospiraceae bacterium]|nr:ABC transporter ATP-binding protein [Oscillospiraceae bacterium]